MVKFEIFTGSEHPTINNRGSIINDIYGTYDLSLNNKYKVKIYQTTLDRVKNYFR